MHILYLHQHFALPEGSTGTRSYELARRWVKAGHRVTLVCGKSDQSGFDLTENKRHYQAAGIDIVALNTKYSNSLSFLSRVFSFFQFILLSFWAGLCVKNADVIYATSTPLTIGIPAMLLKWFKRVPFVFEVRDQWPRIPIEMGIIRNPLLKSLLRWLERCIYKSSAGIVALSPGMADGIRQVLRDMSREVVIAPNSSDLSLFRPDIDGIATRQEMGWQNKFVVLHFGAMGKVNSLGFLIDVSQRVSEYQDIHIVLLGEGRERQNLSNRVSELNLQNIEVRGPVRKNELPEVVAACDVSTVIIGDYPVIQDNSSNKFFDSLSAGKPILINYSGWQRELIETNRCGYGCKLFDVDEYTEKLIQMYADRENLQKMRENARTLAETEFDRDLISNRILTLIDKVNSSRHSKA